MIYPQLIKDDLYVLNHSTKYLARSVQDFRHNYGNPQLPKPADNIAEAWRFPLIDSYSGGAPLYDDPAEFYSLNTATFIWADTPGLAPPVSVGVIGTFTTLHTVSLLRRVQWEGEDTRYKTISFVIPKGQKHRYRFIVDGVPVNDPINPHVEVADNARVWSVFFTEEFTEPLVLEPWELQLLYRLVTTIAPFHTQDQENFLQRFYYSLDQATRANRYTGAYRLDDSVGEVNFIDNQLARAERQHLVDYKLCLDQIDRVLRQRNPYTEPARMSDELYVQLYDQMAANNVPGWDTSRYGNPQYFLYLLRRHTVTGAFSHPRHGGNAGGSGWAFLQERYPLSVQENAGSPDSLFKWRRSLEAPLGTNPDYLA